MAQETLLDENSLYRHLGMHGYGFLLNRYGFKLLETLATETVEPNTPESRAKLGRQIVSDLPTKFKLQNKGKFIAITYTGKILAVCKTLESLNKEIIKKGPKENYYIERLGYDAITQL